MKTKVFKERGGYKLIGDYRDIMVPARYRLAVLSWCKRAGIDANINSSDDFITRSAEKMFGVNLWRVHDDKQRLMFSLRWS